MNPGERVAARVRLHELHPQAARPDQDFVLRQYRRMVRHAQTIDEYTAQGAKVLEHNGRGLLPQPRVLPAHPPVGDAHAAMGAAADSAGAAALILRVAPSSKVMSISSMVLLLIGRGRFAGGAGPLRALPPMDIPPRHHGNLRAQS